LKNTWQLLLNPLGILMKLGTKKDVYFIRTLSNTATVFSIFFEKYFVFATPPKPLGGF
jgi:hypothetical protein